ncbi:RGCVC family protein [Rhodococcus sp. IEGM 1409]|uniref:RGCVC family protein n=1 Tax=Rhodococcus sp. IEGM 1409 TaxID=3047082 RepID=UPI0024B745AB|nr:RGCVC family protein [Rhodococcus sp. IEGM 1409]MDI9902380.1 RGCVC family protein [Rhodococcus sp. IEGM 1409]
MASNPSDVSNARGQAESTDADQKTPSICPACRHSMESHDPLGVRFCAVTADRGLDRKCICAADREEIQHYSRY